MTKGKLALAIFAGLFLILYALIDFLFGYPEAVFPFLAAFFLFFRKPKAAAWLMAAAALAAVIRYVPQIVEYLRDGQRVVNDYGGRVEAIPGRFVVMPILSLLAALLFAGMLFLRGKRALLPIAPIVAAEIAETELGFASAAYVTGHPSPLSVIVPFNYCMAALFTGLYLMTIKPKPPEENDGHSDQ